MKAILQIFSFDIVAKILTGVVSILLIRYMPEQQFARYTFAWSIVLFFSEALSGSFNRIYIVGYDALNLKFAAGAFLELQLFGIAALALLCLPLGGVTGGLYSLIVAVVGARCLTEFTRTVYQHELKFIRYSLVETARTAAFLLSTIALVLTLGHALAAWHILAAQFATLLLVFGTVYGRRLRGIEFLHLGEVRRLARQIVLGQYRYLFGYFALIALLAQTDIFVLRARASEQELATYGSAFRYYVLLLLALSAVHAVLLPVIQHSKSIRDIDGVLSQQRILVAVFIPLVAIGAWLAQWVLPWIDMGKYPGAVTVFRILAASALISFAFSPHVNLLFRFNDFHFLFVLIGLTLAADIVLKLALVSRFGAAGAATATLVAYGCINGSTFLRARRHLASLRTLEATA